MFIWFEVIVSS